MGIDLRTDVFVPVLARIRERAESLHNIKRFPRTGIEAWFKVEIVAVLGNKVKALQNKGPDLKFEDGTEVELKAATDFNKAWFIVEPIRKYGVPCFFLGDGTGQTEDTPPSGDDFEVVGWKLFSNGEWVIGLVKPRR